MNRMTGVVEDTVMRLIDGRLPTDNVYYRGAQVHS